MPRRINNLSLRLILLSILFLSTGCQSRLATPGNTASLSTAVTVVGRAGYLVHQQITLDNYGDGQPEKQNIWIALIRDFPPYQEVKSMEISPKEYIPVTDEYGNQYVEFDFSNQKPGTTQIVTIDYQVVVNELSYDLGSCQGEMIASYTQPELHIESANPQITTLAENLTKGKDTLCQKERSFYDYVGKMLVYTPNNQNWGAQAALGPMGADCTEYTALLMALSRATGIPARYYEGLLYLDKSDNSVAKIEHAWPDVYLPGIGWTALDPTLGRFATSSDKYFAHYTADHIIVTTGVNPSVLRGSNYWTHLYWPGDSTTIRVSGDWKIEPINIDGH